MQHDLIIVGAGPVGASLARAARGLSVALLAHEQRVARAREGFDARVYALSPGNVAFLREIGAMPECATPVYQMRIFGDTGARLEFDAYQAGVPELAWIVEDAHLQEALGRGLEVLAPVRCERMEAGRLFSSAGVIEGRLVVGADGARSFVRQQAGIAASERDYGQEALVANFRCARPQPNVAWQWFQRGAVLALLPLDNAHVSMVWSLPRADAPRMVKDDLPRNVETASGGVLGKLELVGEPRSYPLQRLNAQRLVGPRVALVGDAGHVIHPLAGQGLNLGLQDARELAAVLAAREPGRDPGDVRLLRRYERARAEPILAMDMMVNGLFRLFGADGEIPARVRNAGLSLTDRLPVVKNLLMRQAMR